MGQFPSIFDPALRTAASDSSDAERPYSTTCLKDFQGNIISANIIGKEAVYVEQMGLDLSDVLTSANPIWNCGMVTID